MNGSLNTSKFAVGLGLLLLSLAFSGWYFASSPLSIKLDNKELATLPDTIIHDLNIQQFSAEGHLLHSLKTPLVKHIALNNTHMISLPHIIISRADQSPWEIDALEATGVHNGEKIIFKKHVIIHQPSDKSRQETTLETEEITYFPKTQLATTPKDVILTQAGNTVESTGMNAYLAENRVQLLNRARGIYVPTHG